MNLFECMWMNGNMNINECEYEWIWILMNVNMNEYEYERIWVWISMNMSNVIYRNIYVTEYYWENWLNMYRYGISKQINNISQGDDAELMSVYLSDK